MRALDIEDNPDASGRYDKVILATDADVDGLHIRNLLITYFFKFFESLVHDGHLYVLETPLFRRVAVRKHQQAGDDLLLQRSRARRSREEVERQD